MLGNLHNLDRIVVFMNVVDLESETKAAEHMYLTQACVSKHIKALEDVFGVKLLTRGRKSMVPTDAGRIVYRFAKDLTQSLDEMNTAISEFRGAQIGTLTIGATMTIGNYILPTMLGAFKQQNPGAEITLRIADCDWIYDAVRTGQIELGLTTGINIPEALAVEVIGKDQLVIIVAPNHPLAGQDTITLQQLAELDFIQAPRSGPTVDIITETLSRVGITLRTIMRLDPPEAIKRAVQQNIGTSILYRTSVARELEAGTLCELRVRGLSFWGNFNMTYLPSAYQSPIHSLFRSFLRREIVTLLPDLVPS